MKAKNISNIFFATPSGKARYTFSRGYGIYCEGKGWFSMDGVKPYVLERKHIVQFLIDEGSLITEDAAFIPAL